MENNRKSRVLNKQIDFNNLRMTGKRYNPSSWIAMNYSENDIGYLRYGFTISSRVGSAVIRNKLKRWLREAIKTSIKQGFDKNLDVNIFIKPIGNKYYANLSYAEVKDAINKFTSRFP